MKILYLTLTGADDPVDPKELRKLSEQFPFIEWAILFSDDREGTTRYPTKQWREDFYKAVPECNRSAHLCGKEVLGRLVAQDAALLDELKEYQRIQLNFNATRLDPELLKGLIKVVNSGICTNKSGNLIKFITQLNQANDSISYLFGQIDGHMISNHQVLFDGSGGLGKSPETWSAPLMDKLCGYAGGLGPDNLMSELTKIKTQVEESDGIIDFHTWIDMESKIRTDDKFDLVKALDVATITRNFIREIIGYKSK